MIFLIRLVHGLISLFFLGCIAGIYYSGITNSPSVWAYLAVTALLVEGLVVFANHGTCPLGKVHHKYGDDKTFFELFLPKRLAKRAIPFFSVVTLVGVVLLLI